MARGKWAKATIRDTTAAAKLSEGLRRIATERLRQVEDEGWTPGHDAGHTKGELAMVACCYAAPEPVYTMERAERGVYILFADPWPESWDPEWDKRGQHDRLKQLEIAGALIAAEIDRLIAETEKEENDERTE